MKPTQIIRTTYEAKFRKLSQKYTVEETQELESVISNELATLLEEEIRKEIVFKVAKEHYESLGWVSVKVKNSQDISKDWCEAYIKNPYQSFDTTWFFESERDAQFFLLKWGDQ